MIHFNKLRYVFLACYLTSVSGAHAEDASGVFDHEFYIGAMGGYGWTTWKGLVPPPDKQAATVATIPTGTREGGFLWGFFSGYEIMPYLALEAAYMHYPDATVSFSEDSMFAFDHDGRTSFLTHSESVSLMAKVMAVIPSTSLRIYSSFGVAKVHRSDEITNTWINAPTFGAGFNYNISKYFMAEAGAVYSGGYGQSEVDPVPDYIPFLYSAVLRLAFRFSPF